MRVLMLGGTGFIGSRTADVLRANGHDVVTASRSERADVRVDATDSPALAEVLDDGYDVVVNLLGAGLARATDDADTMHSVNAVVPGTVLNLLSKRAAPPHFIHAASSTERRRPHHRHESVYSETKHEGAMALRLAAADSGVPLTMLTIHNTYGPHQPTTRFVAATIASLRGGQPVVLQHPARVRDFVFIDDVAASIRYAVEHPPVSFEIAEVGTGTGVSLEDAARRIAGALGQPDDLVQSLDPDAVEDDPNPTTVASGRFGTFGLCTTDLDTGLAMTIKEKQCGG